MRLSGWAVAAASTADTSPLFEGLDRLGVALGMNRPGLLPRQPEPERHGLRAHVLGKPLLDEAAQIRQRPAEELALLWNETPQDAGDEGSFLALT
jgi:hypothetical protein